MEITNIGNTITQMLPGVELQPGAASPEGLEPLVRDMLLLLGEDPSREGLLRTPERVARMYAELLSGNHTDLPELLNGAVFETEYQGIVLVRDVEFYSLCKHHLLPFFGKAHVAYIPDGKIIGLSKIPRIVEMFTRRLQVQEDLTQQVADALQSILRPRGVAVVVEAAHMCAMMRGVRKSEVKMVTNAMLGTFREDEKARADLYHMLETVKE